ncbi:MAG TPA: TadE/TadG family type IV pilus assembly protein [Roseiarcus sp.]|nr:TadE/TadG family type IV pilus assembly protein [Roseiarcus sp.]
MSIRFPIILPERIASAASRFRRCERAATAIEFIFVAPIIIAIVLCMLQVAVIFVAQSYLDAMAEDAMRTVLTNNAYALQQSQFKTAVCANVTALFNCNNLIVDLEAAPTSASAITAALPQFNSSGQLVNPTNFNVGAQNTQMILTLMYQWPVISGPLGLSFSNMGNGTYLLVSTQVFYKEPCLNSNGCTQAPAQNG